MLILQILIHRNIASSSSGGHGDVHGVRHAVVAHHNGRYHVSVRGLYCVCGFGRYSAFSVTCRTISTIPQAVFYVISVSASATSVKALFDENKLYFVMLGHHWRFKPRVTVRQRFRQVSTCTR